MAKKTILQIIRRYEFPSTEIGFHYAGIFDGTDSEVTTLYLSGHTEQEDTKNNRAENDLFWEIEKQTSGFVDIRLWFRLYSLIRKNKFKVIICHSNDILFIVAMIRQFFLRFDLIGILHETCKVSTAALKFISFIDKKWLLLLCVSNKVRDDIRQILRNFPEERIQATYPGLDYKRLKANRLSRSEARHRLNLDPDHYLFANVESLGADENQNSLIQSFALASTEFNKTKLVILGSGELEQTLKESAQNLAIEDKILFKQPVGNPGIYLKAFDAIVWSSDNKSFNPILLEAMASGVTIIAATGSGGAKEMMGDTGFLYKQKDVHQLAFHMRQTYRMDDENRVALVKETYDRLKDRFRARACGRKLWSLPITKQLQVHRLARNQM